MVVVAVEEEAEEARGVGVQREGGGGRVNLPLVDGRGSRYDDGLDGGGGA